MYTAGGEHREHAPRSGQCAPCAPARATPRCRSQSPHKRILMTLTVNYAARARRCRMSFQWSVVVSDGVRIDLYVAARRHGHALSHFPLPP